MQRDAATAGGTLALVEAQLAKLPREAQRHRRSEQTGTYCYVPADGDNNEGLVCGTNPWGTTSG